MAEASSISQYYLAVKKKRQIILSPLFLYLVI